MSALVPIAAFALFTLLNVCLLVRGELHLRNEKWWTDLGLEIEHARLYQRWTLLPASSSETDELLNSIARLKRNAPWLKRKFARHEEYIDERGEGFQLP